MVDKQAEPGYRLRLCRKLLNEHAAVVDGSWLVVSWRWRLGFGTIAAAAKF